MFKVLTVMAMMMSEMMSVMMTVMMTFMVTVVAMMTVVSIVRGFLVRIMCDVISCWENERIRQCHFRKWDEICVFLE